MSLRGDASMHTKVTKNHGHRQMAGLIARLIPHLTWRHSGLGVLQAYVHEGETDELRVHVWHPDLRRPGVEESGLLHDHRFDMSSQVLVGVIRQREFELTVRSDGTGAWQLHEVEHARAAFARHAPNNDSTTALPTRYHVAARDVEIYAGERYFFPKRRVHGTYIDGLVVTLVTKSNQDKAPACILAPYGAPVVHAFAETLPESSWQIPLQEARAALMNAWSGK